MLQGILSTPRCGICRSNVVGLVTRITSGVQQPKLHHGHIQL